MATANNEHTQSEPVSECLILDTSAAHVHPDMGSLLQSIEKTQGACLGKVATGLRGYNLTGFAAKVYATPEHPTDGAPYRVRVQFEYDCTIKSGANYERTRSAYMDALASGETPKVERTRVAKPTT